MLSVPSTVSARRQRQKISRFMESPFDNAALLPTYGRDPLALEVNDQRGAAVQIADDVELAILTAGNPDFFDHLQAPIGSQYLKHPGDDFPDVGRNFVRSFQVCIDELGVVNIYSDIDWRHFVKQPCHLVGPVPALNRWTKPGLEHQLLEKKERCCLNGKVDGNKCFYCEGMSPHNHPLGVQVGLEHSYDR